jgi:hypothetical protein
VAESIDRALAELRALRALRMRVKERRLDADDWAVVSAVLAKQIDEAEPGQEVLVFELAEEDGQSGEKAERSPGPQSSASRNRQR